MKQNSLNKCVNKHQVMYKHGHLIYMFNEWEYFNFQMINYYSFKENNPEIHKSLNPLNMRHIGDDNVLSVLPYREQTGRRIMIYKIGK